MKLRRVGEGDLGGLCGHGLGDFFGAVADVNDGSLAGRIEIALTVRRGDPAAFAADGGWERFLEVAGEERRVRRHTTNCSRGRKRQRRGAEYAEKPRGKCGRLARKSFRGFISQS